MEINPKIKSLWVAALRSGNYKQGFHEYKRVVKDQTFYSALGVLIHLFNPSLSVDSTERLPNEVAIWAGTSIDPRVMLSADDQIMLVKLIGKNIFSYDPSYPIVGFHFQSIEMLNDAGADFNTLANLIEKY